MLWTVAAIVGVTVIVIGWACLVVAGRADDRAERLYRRMVERK